MYKNVLFQIQAYYFTKYNCIDLVNYLEDKKIVHIRLKIRTFLINIK